jgi:hypothetical protein
MREAEGGEESHCGEVCGGKGQVEGIAIRRWLEIGEDALCN